MTEDNEKPESENERGPDEDDVVRQQAEVAERIRERESERARHLIPHLELALQAARDMALGHNAHVDRRRAIMEIRKAAIELGISLD